MRKKTFLSAAEQWNRTLALYKREYWRGDVPFQSKSAGGPGMWHFDLLGKDLFLGRIIGAHRLFRKGDLVLIQMSNGADERQPVIAVSSKGYTVKNFYLEYHAYLSINRSKNEPMRKFDQGPLRFVELPDDLVGKRPDDPATYRFIAGLYAQGKP